MARLLRNNGTPLPQQITLFEGNSLNFKISGLASNKQHVILQSSDPVLKVVPVRVNHGNIEQNLRLEVGAASSMSRRVAYVEAYVADASGHPQQIDLGTPRLTVNILPKLKLPLEETEAGIVTRMLIVENAGPGSPTFVNQYEALESMQWMRHVLINRIKLGSQHFAAGRAETLTDIIKAHNQVEGFGNYPRIAPLQTYTLNDMLNIANDASDARHETYRTYIENAISVAEGKNTGTDPCPTKLYAWKTEGSKSPGSNFVRFRAKGGQDFYTLAKDFLSKASAN